MTLSAQFLLRILFKMVVRQYYIYYFILVQISFVFFGLELYGQEVVNITSSEIGQGILRKKTFKYYKPSDDNYDFLVVPLHAVKNAEIVDVTGQFGIKTKGYLFKTYPDEDVAIVKLIGSDLNAEPWGRTNDIQNTMLNSTNATVETRNTRGGIDLIEVEIVEAELKHVKIIPKNKDQGFRSGMSGSLLKINGIGLGMLLSTDPKTGIGKVIRLDFLEVLFAPHFHFIFEREKTKSELNEIFQKWVYDIKSMGYISIRKHLLEDIYYHSKYIKSIRFGEEINNLEIEISIEDFIMAYYLKQGEVRVPYGIGDNASYCQFTHKDGSISKPYKLNLLKGKKNFVSALVLRDTLSAYYSPIIYVDHEYKAQFMALPGTVETRISFDDINEDYISLKAKAHLDMHSLTLPKGIHKITLKSFYKDQPAVINHYSIEDWESYYHKMHKNKWIHYIELINNKKRANIVKCQYADSEESLRKVSKNKKYYFLKSRVKKFPSLFCYDKVSPYANMDFFDSSITLRNFYVIKKIHVKNKNGFQVTFNIDIDRFNLNFPAFFQLINADSKTSLSMIFEFYDGTVSQEMVIPIDILD